MEFEMKMLGQGERKKRKRNSSWERQKGGLVRRLEGGLPKMNSYQIIGIKSPTTTAQHST
jgi:hypothetical protein